MVKLNESEIAFIKDNFDNYQELINAKNVNDILDPLDRLITYKGFIRQESLNEFGQKAQKIYDDIYYNNVNEED